MINVMQYNVGESARNAYTRGKEHINEFKNKQESSIMQRHNRECHANNNDITYTMQVKNIYGDNSFERQISEGIQINNITKIDLRINNKSEWSQNEIPRASLTWE